LTFRVSGSSSGNNVVATTVAVYEEIFDYFEPIWNQRPLASEVSPLRVCVRTIRG
jgi:hypothetical protein